MFGDPVVVRHASGAYPVYVATHSLWGLDQLVREHLSSRRLVMIADHLAWDVAQSGRWGQVNWKGEVLTFPGEEQSKTRASWARLTDALLERRYGRDSGIVSLGGGVAGDLVGFVAATYMRGVPYVQVPTTLLAMVDASIGGKTGVNTPAGKNLVGAFYPPAAVLADPGVLLTLPDEVYRGGMAETVKHGLIGDREYFEWIEHHAEGLVKRDLQLLTHLVRRSIEIKTAVVSADERETGRRAILNAGHTVAHALEQASGFQLSHGNAVSLGLVVETMLAEQLGIAPSGVHRRVLSLLDRLGLPTRQQRPLDPELLLSAMAGDKKNREGAIHFALVAELGRMHHDAGWTTPVMSTSIAPALHAIS